MEENKFWLCLWSIGGFIVCTLIICVTLSNASSNQKIVDLVGKGVNPIQAACAINGAGSQQILCFQQK